MNKCTPIKDTNIIDLIKESYRKKNNERDLLLFLLSINTGLRITELLHLSVKDVKNKKGLIIVQDDLYNRLIPFNKEMKELINKITKGKNLNSPLFLTKNNKPIDRTTVFLLFKNICKDLGLSEDISIKSWRKTFAYFHYKKYRDLSFLSWFFNHNSIEQTIDYIGLDDLNFATMYQEGISL
ncbi:TPA: tyrosine-type recombinase/integrase [Candidatus Avigastranaerophilus faecigallinarum]|nr:tyrosine-type recombinase/integrase [Candidatus Avigastranaerophilus faecigallinarum]